MPPRINKFLVSIAATLGIVSTSLADGNVTEKELAAIVVSAIGTVLVYLVPNFHGPDGR